ncbi:hypothetical protein GPECTOR_21g756 [Gonium pectorale]|uniref:Uncharacterized protein n=1 Tax=Gonium pectorale TaxID=33097 RepID=A0A150GI77_GONPE|nr:hypothetical protein GPECTOR_21g756 [Gonium pectorale]|eukprot:KXZ49528.1 hypothetical protein GPECTOR_21g756 [Gonium pectorale]
MEASLERLLADGDAEACLSVLATPACEGGPGPLDTMRLAQSLLTRREALGLGPEQVAAVLRHLAALCQSPSAVELIVGSAPAAAAAVTATVTSAAAASAGVEPLGDEPATAARNEDGQERGVEPVTPGINIKQEAEERQEEDAATAAAAGIWAHAAAAALADQALGGPESVLPAADADAAPDSCASDNGTPQPARRQQGGWDWGLLHCSSMERNNAAGGGLARLGSGPLATHGSGLGTTYGSGHFVLALPDRELPPLDAGHSRLLPPQILSPGVRWRVEEAEAVPTPAPSSNPWLDATLPMPVAASPWATGVLVHGGPAAAGAV